MKNKNVPDKQSAMIRCCVAIKNKNKKEAQKEAQKEE